MTPTELMTQGQEVAAEALTWPERARALRVVDAETYTEAGGFLKGIKALRQKIADTFDPHIKRAHEAHRALVKEKQDIEAPLAEAERLLKDSLIAHDQEQERIRRAEQRRLDEEARRQDEERRLEEAAAMEREGNATNNPELLYEANELIERPAPVQPVSVAKATPKVAGIVHRDNWSARVLDVKKLVAYVAAHPEQINLLTPNTAALNSLARAMKTELKIDGVQAINTPIVAASR